MARTMLWHGFESGWYLVGARDRIDQFCQEVDQSTRAGTTWTSPHFSTPDAKTRLEHASLRNPQYLEGLGGVR